MVPLLLALAVMLAPVAADPYDRTVRDNARVADMMQGPLDGAWLLTGAAGERLFQLQLSDPTPDEATAEGAWRDLAVRPGADSTGLIAFAGMEGDRFVIRFVEGAQGPVVIRVARSAPGLWTGTLTRGGRQETVALRRDG